MPTCLTGEADLVLRVEADHIQNWVAAHGAVIGDQALAVGLDGYLGGLPWGPSRLRWSSIKHREFELQDGWEKTVVSAVANAPVGQHSHLLFMYSAEEPVLIAPRDHGIRDVDLIYAAAPGARYFCGADLTDGVVAPAYADFAEFDGFAMLTFRS